MILISGAKARTGPATRCRMTFLLVWLGITAAVTIIDPHYCRPGSPRSRAELKPLAGGSHSHACFGPGFEIILGTLGVAAELVL